MAKQALKVRGKIIGSLDAVRLEILLATNPADFAANPLQKHEIARHPTINNKPMLRKWRALFARLESNTRYYVQTRLYRNGTLEQTSTRSYRTDDDNDA